MLIAKYQPYRETINESTFILKKFGSLIQPLMIVHINQDQKRLIIDNHDKNSIQVFAANGKMLFEDKYQEQRSNLVVVNQTKIAYFSSSQNILKIVDIEALSSKNQSIQNNCEREASIYKLFFFKNTQTFGLNKIGEITKISYFKYSEQALDLVQEYTVESDLSKNQFYKINDRGMVGWCFVREKEFQINLCSVQQGHTCFSDIQNLTFGSSKVLTMTSGGSYTLHVVLDRSENQQGLPILVVKMTNNMAKVIEVQFAKQFEGKHTIPTPIRALVLQDLILLQSLSYDKQYYHIYSVKKQGIIDIEQTPLEKTPQLSNFTHQSRTFLQISSSEQAITIKQHQIKRVNSLSVMKMLQAIDIIKREQDNYQTAILIFGAQGSGKSTLINYLCGNQLQHLQSQGGFYHVKLKNEVQNQYVDEPQKDKIIEISTSKETLIIQIPDWGNSHYFQSQIFLLIKTMLKKIKRFHTVVTISEQYIEDSERNSNLFNSILKMVKHSEDQISNTISVVLTKLEHSDVVQEFKERIEEIGQLSEEVGIILNTINENDQIFVFQNKEPLVEQGIQMLKKILSSPSLLVSEEMIIKIQETHKNSQGFNLAQKQILNQASFYFQVLDKLLSYLCHQNIKEPGYFQTGYFNNEVFHFDKQLIIQENKVDSTAMVKPLFKVIAGLKILIEKEKGQESELMEAIKNNFVFLMREYKQIGSQSQKSYLKQSITLFMAALTLPQQFTTTENAYCDMIEFFRENSSGIFDNLFSVIVNKLIEIKPELKGQPEMKEISPFLINKSAHAVVITKIEVMSYSQEKKQYLNKKSILKTICGLPLNVMKLDLMIEVLLRLSKQGVSDDNMREIRFYLKQSSRVCQFHQLYLEAIIFLMVIPDFYGIQLLLDDLVLQSKQNSSYEKKTIFSRIESDLIDQLITICRNCVRDNLVRKLIYLKMMNIQTKNTSKDIKTLESRYMTKQLSTNDSLKKYLEKLETGKDLPFFNMKNGTFIKLIEKDRDQLIKKCKQFEEDKKTSRGFESLQALNWVVESEQIPV